MTTVARFQRAGTPASLRPLGGVEGVARRGRTLLVAFATLAGFAAVAASQIAMLDSP